MGILNVIKDEVLDIIEERKRWANRPYMKCEFDDGITYEQFCDLAHKAVDSIKGRHIEIAVHGPMIEGIVSSRSNLSTWTFTVDFNDFGHITGKYWIRSENDQSTIPENIGRKVSLGIDQILFKLYKESGETEGD